MDKKQNKKMLSTRSNIKKMEKNQKEYQKLNFLYINIIRKTNFQSGKDDWKKFVKNNPTNALNILYAKKEGICPAYVSKHNSMMALSCGKNISAILRGVTSKHIGYFYCLNCLHSFGTKNKIKSHEEICENEDFCDVTIPCQENRLLEFI